MCTECLDTVAILAFTTVPIDVCIYFSVGYQNLIKCIICSVDLNLAQFLLSLHRGKNTMAFMW